MTIIAASQVHVKQAQATPWIETNCIKAN